MCSVSFVRLDGKATTQLLVLCAPVYPVEEKSPFAIRRSQAIPVQHWSGD